MRMFQDIAHADHLPKSDSGSQKNCTALAHGAARRRKTYEQMKKPTIILPHPTKFERVFL
jgi:hypothetical protein